MYSLLLFVEASKPASPRFAEIGNSGTSARSRIFPPRSSTTRAGHSSLNGVSCDEAH